MFWCPCSEKGLSGHTGLLGHVWFAKGFFFGCALWLSGCQGLAQVSVTQQGVNRHVVVSGEQPTCFGVRAARSGCQVAPACWGMFGLHFFLLRPLAVRLPGLGPGKRHTVGGKPTCCGIRVSHRLVNVFFLLVLLPVRNLKAAGGRTPRRVVGEAAGQWA